MSTTTRILWVSLLMDATFFCAWAAVPFLVRARPELRLDDAELGFLRAASSCAYVSGSFFLSQLWVGRNHALLARLTVFGTAVCTMLAALAPTPLVLVAFLVLGTALLSVFWPNLMALVGDVGTKPLVTRIASFNCWWSVGKSSAYLGAGSLLQFLGDPRAALVVGGAAMLVIAVLVPGARRRPSEAAEPGPETSEPARTGDSLPPPTPARPSVSSEAMAIEIPGSERVFVTGLVGVFSGWLIAGCYETHFGEGFGRAAFGARFGEHYELAANLLLFALFGGQAIAFLLLRATPRWPRKTGLLGAALIAVPAGQALLLLTPPHPLIFALTLAATGFATAFCYGMSLYHAQAGRTDKVRRSGLHEGSLSLGSLLGALLGGVLMRATGEPKVALALTTAVTLLAAIVGVRRLARAR